MSTLDHGGGGAVPLLEVCVETSEACIKALRSGASRIELCSRLDLGGMSPSLELVKEVMLQMSLEEGPKGKLPLMIMVRLSGPSFFYSDHTVDLMCDYIDQVKQLNSAMLEEASSKGQTSISSYFMGFVFGCTETTSVETLIASQEPSPGGLDKNIGSTSQVKTTIAEHKMGRLISRSRPYSITFHRAFDEITDKTEAVTVLWRYNIDRILTSGGKGSVDNHMPTLQQLIALATTLNKEANTPLEKQSVTQGVGYPHEAVHRIIIMPGGGVRPYNAQLLVSLGAEELHSSVPFHLIPTQLIN